MVVSIVATLIKNNERLRRDFSLADQLRRAAYSIMLNISEGFERNSDKEFAHFLNVAKGSAGELRSIIYIIADNGYVSRGHLTEIHFHIEHVSNQLSKFRAFLLDDS